jgi:type II secretory pathway component PulF
VNADLNILILILLGLFGLCVSMVMGGGLVFLLHYLISLPMRRAERARLFLDLAESALTRGRPLEETLISVSRSGDASLGTRFHLMAAWLERNLSLSDALDKVPRYLPPQITAMLKAGQKIGDLKKVFAACRQLLKDGVSQTRGAISYLVILTLVITPLGAFVLSMMQVAIIPKFRAISLGMGVGTNSSGIEFLYHHGALLIMLQIGLLLLLWLAALIYIAGPRLAHWFPVLDQVYYRLPWRRKRMQRDFSTLLAILLDSGVPEPEAVALAADGTANTVFQRRAARVVENLRQGMNLTRAVEALDDSGEFAWRLANAEHGRTGFLGALAGWHESLDAKAFQQEQAAAHGITSALVLWSGLYVGAVAISAFTFLTSIINSSDLW